MTAVLTKLVIYGQLSVLLSVVVFAYKSQSVLNNELITADQKLYLQDKPTTT